MGPKLVAVAAVAALLAYLFWPRKNDLLHDVPSDVHLCKERMSSVYRGWRRQEREGVLVTNGGYAMLAGLLAKGTWEDTEENRARLSCPGPRSHDLPRERFDDLAAFGPDDTAFACRDLAAHPLVKFPAGGRQNEPLLACDNANGMNHDGVMNILYTDGSIVTLRLTQEIERGRLTAGATTIPVGPDSPIEDLKELK